MAGQGPRRRGTRIPSKSNANGPGPGPRSVPKPPTDSYSSATHAQAAAHEGAPSSRVRVRVTASGAARSLHSIVASHHSTPPTSSTPTVARPLHNIHVPTAASEHSSTPCAPLYDEVRSTALLPASVSRPSLSCTCEATPVGWKSRAVAPCSSHVTSSHSQVKSSQVGALQTHSRRTLDVRSVPSMELNSRLKCNAFACLLCSRLLSALSAACGALPTMCCSAGHLVTK